ncbi:uncharacterized protein LOC108675380 [Hyalella azteca]|uniref:Uncharacterized protein LOC108675380 n=1 Tax=Hyalella azteca TaxID=294128 RepID=A0A8B7NYI4_HYAAZ|nr:uncharacterized protein LOC108675380 [Hyalella azteca]
MNEMTSNDMTNTKKTGWIPDWRPSLFSLLIHSILLLRLVSNSSSISEPSRISSALQESRMQQTTRNNPLDQKDYCKKARCLDVSSTKDLSLEIINDVDFVFASNGNCTVQNLTVWFPTLLHCSIGSSCSHLSLISMQGPDWDCSWDDWDWLLQWPDSHHRVINQTTLTCKNVTEACSNTDNHFNTGLNYQKACMEGETACAPCQCTYMQALVNVTVDSTKQNLPSSTDTVSYEDGEAVCPSYLGMRKQTLVIQSTVDCSKRNLTDDDIPRNLPRNADILSFEGNQLVTGETLMKQAADMPYLKIINLNGNKLTSVPEIQPQHKSNIKYISLDNNSIEHLLGDAFNSYLSRSRDLKISVKGNPLICGCQFYIIDTELRKIDGKLNVFQFVADFTRVECEDGPLPKLYPDESCPDHLKDQLQDSDGFLDIIIALLAIINLIFIGLGVDLQISINKLKQGYSQPREPYIHQLYMFICRCCRTVRGATVKSNRAPGMMNPCSDFLLDANCLAAKT